METKKSDVQSSSEPGQNVVELRNSKEIERAIVYAEQELITHLELGTADSDSKRLLATSVLAIITQAGLGKCNSEIAKKIDEFFNSVGELEQASIDLLAGLEAQIAELASKREEVPQNTIGKSEFTLEQIEEELTRRQQWSELARQIQEEWEDRRDTVREELTVQTELIKHGAVENLAKSKANALRIETELRALVQVVETIVQVQAENNREVSILTTYKHAIELVTQGLPESLIGKDLPQFTPGGKK